MNAFKTLSSAMLCAAGLAALGANANANTIPVVNADFSMFPTTPSIFDGVFPVGTTAATYLFFGCPGTGCRFADDDVVGWTSSSTFAPGAFSGQWQIGAITGPAPSTRFIADPIFNGTPEPIVLRSQGASISQVVSTTATPGVTYTLDVDVGFSLLEVDKGLVELIVGNHTVTATPLVAKSKHAVQRRVV